MRRSPRTNSILYQWLMAIPVGIAEYSGRIEWISRLALADLAQTSLMLHQNEQEEFYLIGFGMKD